MSSSGRNKSRSARGSQEIRKRSKKRSKHQTESNVDAPSASKPFSFAPSSSATSASGRTVTTLPSSQASQTSLSASSTLSPTGRRLPPPPARSPGKSSDGSNSSFSNRSGSGGIRTRTRSNARSEASDGRGSLSLSLPTRLRAMSGVGKFGIKKDDIVMTARGLGIVKNIESNNSHMDGMNKASHVLDAARKSEVFKYAVVLPDAAAETAHSAQDSDANGKESSVTGMDVIGESEIMKKIKSETIVSMLAQLQKGLTEANKDINEKESELSELKEKYENAAGEKEKLSARIIELKKYYSSFEKKVKSMEAAKKKTERENRTLRDDIKTLKKMTPTKNIYNKQVQVLNKKNRTLNETVKMQDVDMQRLRNEIERLKSRNAKNSEAYKSLKERDDIVALRRDMSKLTQKKVSLEKENERLRRQLAAREFTKTKIIYDHPNRPKHEWKRKVGKDKIVVHKKFVLKEFYDTIERLRRRRNTLEKNAPKIKNYQTRLEELHKKLMNLEVRMKQEKEQSNDDSELPQDLLQEYMKVLAEIEDLENEMDASALEMQDVTNTSKPNSDFETDTTHDSYDSDDSKTDQKLLSSIAEDISDSEPDLLKLKDLRQDVLNLERQLSSIHSRLSESSRALDDIEASKHSLDSELHHLMPHLHDFKRLPKQRIQHSIFVSNGQLNNLSHRVAHQHEFLSKQSKSLDTAQMLCNRIDNDLSVQNYIFDQSNQSHRTPRNSHACRELLETIKVGLDACKQRMGSNQVHLRSLELSHFQILEQMSDVKEELIQSLPKPLPSSIAKDSRAMLEAQNAHKSHFTMQYARDVAGVTRYDQTGRIHAALVKIHMALGAVSPLHFSVVLHYLKEPLAAYEMELRDVRKALKRMQRMAQRVRKRGENGKEVGMINEENNDLMLQELANYTMQGVLDFAADCHHMCGAERIEKSLQTIGMKLEAVAKLKQQLAEVKELEYIRDIYQMWLNPVYPQPAKLDHMQTSPASIMSHASPAASRRSEGMSSKNNKKVSQHGSKKKLKKSEDSSVVGSRGPGFGTIAVPPKKLNKKEFVTGAGYKHAGLGVNDTASKLQEGVNAIEKELYRLRAEMHDMGWNVLYMDGIGFETVSEGMHSKVGTNDADDWAHVMEYCEKSNLDKLSQDNKSKLIAELMELEWEYIQLLVSREDDATQSDLNMRVGLYYRRLFTQPLDDIRLEQAREVLFDDLLIYQKEQLTMANVANSSVTDPYKFAQHRKSLMSVMSTPAGYQMVHSLMHQVPAEKGGNMNEYHQITSILQSYDRFEGDSALNDQIEQLCKDCDAFENKYKFLLKQNKDLEFDKHQLGMEVDHLNQILEEIQAEHQDEMPRDKFYEQRIIFEQIRDNLNKCYETAALSAGKVDDATILDTAKHGLYQIKRPLHSLANDFNSNELDEADKIIDHGIDGMRRQQKAKNYKRQKTLDHIKKVIDGIDEIMEAYEKSDDNGSNPYATQKQSVQLSALDGVPPPPPADEEVGDKTHSKPNVTRNGTKGTRRYDTVDPRYGGTDGSREEWPKYQSVFKKFEDNFPMVTSITIEGNWMQKYALCHVKYENVEILRKMKEFEWLWRMLLLDASVDKPVPDYPTEMPESLWPQGYLRRRKRELNLFLMQCHSTEWIKKHKAYYSVFLAGTTEKFKQRKKEFNTKTVSKAKNMIAKAKK